MKRTSLIILAILVLALSGLACQTVTALPTSQTEVESPSTDATNPPVAVVPAVTEASEAQVTVLDMISAQDTLIGLYQRVNPGVVSIRVLTEEGGGLGSGFVIDTQGHVVTNYHVIEGVTDLEVAFASGFKARGEVIGEDLDSDLAIIKVDAPESELFPLPLGDSDAVQVGQTVIAIGNPFGLAGTMTTGIVSGTGRTLESLHTTSDGGTFSAGDIIQTDAAINPGNSGGPLLNLQGEVVGVNESIRTSNFTTTGEPTNSGIGFAVSINIVKKVAPSLIADGKYDYPYLGITSLDDLTLVYQEALDLPTAAGVYVTGVTPGGPADRAGVRSGNLPSDITGLPSGGDLITAIDDEPVTNFNDLISYLVKNKGPGETVELTIFRGSDEIKLEVTLDKRPNP
ncbi:MAG TPA: trypsin-like peptidase domain-containing protein [Anaerolineales bacterium]|nr:trypsin-like peptidase domain-containing protein [Anaerolineales bacterium]